jgi:hypothetical protein
MAKQPNEPGYLNELLRQGIEAKRTQGAGLYIATVAHDDWCDLLNKRGACNCNPDVTTAKWKP